MVGGRQGEGRGRERGGREMGREERDRLREEGDGCIASVQLTSNVQDLGKTTLLMEMTEPP